MKTLLKNANVLTMETRELLLGADLIFEDGKILKIAKNIDGAGSKSVDCTGKYLIPGLFDMHVHINSSEMLQLFIACGVTSVRNMWGFPIQLEWNKQAWRGELLSPYIYSTGPLTDGVMYWAGSVIVTTPEEAEAAVLRDIKDGYLYFKAYPSIPKDAFLHLLAVAKKNNFKVVGHGNSFLSWKTLADFGYYCCEHTNCLPDDESDITYMAKSGMWLCPTHVVVKTIADYVYAGKTFNDYPYKEYVTPRNMKEWEDITVWRKTNGKYDLAKPYPMEKVIARALKFIETAGPDKIILGTDTPNPGVVAGLPIFDELNHLVNDYKMNTFDAIKAGTVNGALHLGIEKQKGVLAEGFDADILILDADPLADIRNISKLNTVIQGGRIYDRTRLDAILENARKIKDEEITFVYEAQ
jgi:imidazolonepropionase-like amidohydrolase